MKCGGVVLRGGRSLGGFHCDYKHVRSARVGRVGSVFEEKGYVIVYIYIYTHNTGADCSTLTEEEPLVRPRWVPKRFAAVPSKVSVHPFLCGCWSLSMKPPH